MCIECKEIQRKKKGWPLIKRIFKNITFLQIREFFGNMQISNHGKEYKNHITDGEKGQLLEILQSSHSQVWVFCNGRMVRAQSIKRKEEILLLPK